MATTAAGAAPEAAAGFATRLARLRRRMIGWGWDRDAIAAALAAEFRLRPRAAYRYAAGLSGHQAADAYNDLFGSAEHPAPMSKARISEHEHWPLGRATRKPSLLVLDNLAALYNTTRRRLVDHHDYAAFSAIERQLLDAHPPASAAHSIHTPAWPAACTATPGTNDPRRTPTTPGALVLTGTPWSALAERNLIMAAAHQAGEHAGSAGAGNLDEATLDQLHDHVTRLGRAYLTGPMLPVFADLVAVRNRTYELLERTQRPPQRHELYLIAGQLSCLLAGTSCDLGYPQAAVEQARAAATYGELIGHPSLRAYAYGQLAMFFYLQDHYHRAVDAARAGQQHAAPGSPKLRLRSLEALAHSRLGNTDAALTALDAARRARDEVTGNDEIHDLTGGMFTSTPAKQAYMTGMTYIHLGQPDDAAREAAAAVTAYTTGPAEERAEGALTVARIDLVTAHLMHRDLDAAAHDILPVLAQPADQRTTIVLTRVAAFQHRLNQPPYTRSPDALDLAARIEDFRATATIHHLPNR